MSQVARDPELPRPFYEGLVYHPLYFTASAQRDLLGELARIVAEAPPFQPVMPRTGKPLSVLMSNCGSWGWIAGRSGYRYVPAHPVTGRPWPPIPPLLRELWSAVASPSVEPEACLINLYAGTAKMGSHQDRDEADFSYPVVSVSLGDDAVFHVGPARAGRKQRFTLRSGDVIVLGGSARRAFHGIDRVIPGTSSLDLSGFHPTCRRLNLTLRRVTAGMP